MTEPPKQPARRQTITEMDVMTIVSRSELGESTKGIARTLGLSRHTVQDVLLGRLERLRDLGILRGVR